MRGVGVVNEDVFRRGSGGSKGGAESEGNVRMELGGSC